MMVASRLNEEKKIPFSLSCLRNLCGGSFLLYKSYTHVMEGEKVVVTENFHRKINHLTQKLLFFVTYLN